MSINRQHHNNDGTFTDEYTNQVFDGMLFKMMRGREDACWPIIPDKIKEEDREKYEKDIEKYEDIRYKTECVPIEKLNPEQAQNLLIASINCGLDSLTVISLCQDYNKNKKRNRITPSAIDAIWEEKYKAEGIVKKLGEATVNRFFCRYALDKRNDNTIPYLKNKIPLYGNNDREIIRAFLEMHGIKIYLEARGSSSGARTIFFETNQVRENIVGDIERPLLLMDNNAFRRLAIRFANVHKLNGKEPKIDAITKILQDSFLEPTDPCKDYFISLRGKNHYKAAMKEIESGNIDNLDISNVLTYIWEIEDLPQKEHTKEYLKWVSRLIYCSGVQRTFEPGCTLYAMPVFGGPQGSGKSLFVKYFHPFGEDRWTNNVKFDKDNRSRMTNLPLAFVVEHEEIQTYSKSQLGEIKSAQSTGKLADTLKHQNELTVVLDRTIHIGTGNNEGSGILPNDPEGHRRMATIMIKGKYENKDYFSHFENHGEMLKWLSENMKKFWCQAVALYDSGKFSSFMPEHLREASTEQNKENSVKYEGAETVLRGFMEAGRDGTQIKLPENKPAELEGKECIQVNWETLYTKEQIVQIYLWKIGNHNIDPISYIKSSLGGPHAFNSVLRQCPQIENNTKTFPDWAGNLHPLGKGRRGNFVHVGGFDDFFEKEERDTD